MMKYGFPRRSWDTATVAMHTTRSSKHRAVPCCCAMIITSMLATVHGIDYTALYGYPIGDHYSSRPSNMLGSMTGKAEMLRPGLPGSCSLLKPRSRKAARPIICVPHSTQDAICHLLDAGRAFGIWHSSAMARRCRRNQHKSAACCWSALHPDWAIYEIIYCLLGPSILSDLLVLCASAVRDA